MNSLSLLKLLRSCHKISLAFKLILNFLWKCHVTWNWSRNLRTLRSIQWLEMHVGDFRNYSHFINEYIVLTENKVFYCRYIIRYTQGTLSSTTGIALYISCLVRPPIFFVRKISCKFFNPPFFGKSKFPE